MLSQELLENSEQRMQLAKALKPGSYVYVMGICGTGTTQVAVLLKQRGFIVKGSDKAFYPPMGEIIRQTADEVFTGYEKEHLMPHPDFVVVGNSIGRANPEAQYLLESNIPFCSMPEAFNAWLIGERNYCPTSIVVAGTHGKTTTSAAVSMVFDYNGYKPGYFIGGAPINFPSGIRGVDTSIEASKRVVVLEGDEYDSAFFAKWAKFQNYRPDIAVITSLEFDHGDIYETIEDIEKEFTTFVRRVPKDGSIFLWFGQERLRKLASNWANDPSVQGKTYFYGQNPQCPCRLMKRDVYENKQILTCSIFGETIELETSLSGEHNANNLLLAASVGYQKKLSKQEIVNAIKNFNGVKRRQQIIAQNAGIIVIEDFAHHPTAVDVTLRGIKERYSQKRIIAVFEPRSNTSKRAYFQDDYRKAFSAADMVIMQEVTDASGYSKSNQPIIALDVARIIRSLKESGKNAYCYPVAEEVCAHVLGQMSANDVIVIMSNGDFGGIMRKIATAVNEKS
ncbi:MAG: hypothetical protein IT292_05900 [Deltaproteobacteria bacterium]|nr:hypothetical protein [Deltaproteobacteria bacterium]